MRRDHEIPCNQAAQLSLRAYCNAGGVRKGAAQQAAAQGNVAEAQGRPRLLQPSLLMFKLQPSALSSARRRQAEGCRAETPPIPAGEGMFATLEADSPRAVVCGGPHVRPSMPWQQQCVGQKWPQL